PVRPVVAPGAVVPAGVPAPVRGSPVREPSPAEPGRDALSGAGPESAGEGSEASSEPERMTRSTSDPGTTGTRPVLIASPSPAASGSAASSRPGCPGADVMRSVTVGGTSRSDYRERRPG